MKKIIILKFILFLSFFQQVLVVNVGGSIRLVDLLCIFAGIGVLFTAERFSGRYLVFAFLLFVITPLLGTLMSFIKYDDFDIFYSVFGAEARSLRYNKILAPVTIYLYYLIIFSYVLFLSSFNYTERQYRSLCRIFILTGFVTCLYCLYGIIFVRQFGFPDLIPSFIDARNNTPVTEARPSGFSSEAGDFSFMLVWVVLLQRFNGGLFKPKLNFTINTVVYSTLIMTLSTSLLGLFIAVLIYTTFWKSKLLNIVAINILFLAFVYLAKSQPIIYYVFYQKLVIVADTMLNGSQPIGSAGIRGYHWHLGLDLFRDNWLFGVGGGNSYFHLWRFDEFRLAHLDGPKNLYIKVASELGITGLLLLLFLYITFFVDIRRVAHLDPNLANLGFLGLIYFAISITALSTIYSLWMWVVPLFIFFRIKHKLNISDNFNESNKGLLIL